MKAPPRCSAHFESRQEPPLRAGSVRSMVGKRVVFTRRTRVHVQARRALKRGAHNGIGAVKHERPAKWLREKRSVSDLELSSLAVIGNWQCRPRRSLLICRDP
jgi:hypothetical protein